MNNWYFVDLYRLCGNQAGEAEGYRMHDSFSQSLLKDHFQSSQLAEHKLIQVNPLRARLIFEALKHHVSIVIDLRSYLILNYSRPYIFFFILVDRWPVSRQLHRRNGIIRLLITEKT